MQTEVIKLVEAAEAIIINQPGYIAECDCNACIGQTKRLTDLTSAVEKVKELL